MHERFMKRAISLARRGEGRVSPNPLVGAVVVKNQTVIGEGYHLYARKDHAEVVALQRAGRRSSGASLYLNLEPCVHFGRTSPCVDRIIQAGLREVFVAMKDPNPLVSGKGLKKLRRHGIVVHEGLCREAAQHLNEKFFHFIQTGQPFVLLKLALTLDGKMATRSGDSQWITGDRSRKEAHRLRYQYDGILVGIRTLLKDNPSLNVRWSRRNRITRVILDTGLRTPAQAKIFRSDDPVVIFHGQRAAKKRIRNLSSWATLVAVPVSDGRLDWSTILGQLGQLKVSSLIVEGGTRVAASALRSGIVQKVNFFYGPRIIGADGQAGIEDLGVTRLKEAVQLNGTRLKRFGSDFLVEAYLSSPDYA